ncbi:MAG TPA: DUF4386 domain-containing protein [Prolixibacteraceae bacterium]|nr:DUF4386 domain-containing protein [Prolixibacteraceae bacterium]
MNKTINTAKIAGVLFLIAMLASLVGGGLLETAKVSSTELFFITGIALEIVNALAVLGIGILLFPTINRFHKHAARFYLSLRILESVACLAAPLVLVLFNNSSDLRMFFTGKMIPLFFCGGAFVLYTVLYIYRLLPRFISIWGFFGVLGIIILNITSTESGVGMLLALPIILNEIFLGIWLIVKGFNKPQL